MFPVLTKPRGSRKASLRSWMECASTPKDDNAWAREEEEEEEEAAGGPCSVPSAAIDEVVEVVIRPGPSPLGTLDRTMSAQDRRGGGGAATVAWGDGGTGAAVPWSAEGVVVVMATTVEPGGVAMGSSVVTSSEDDLTDVVPSMVSTGAVTPIRSDRGRAFDVGACDGRGRAGARGMTGTIVLDGLDA